MPDDARLRMAMRKQERRPAARRHEGDENSVDTLRAAAETGKKVFEGSARRSQFSSLSPRARDRLARRKLCSVIPGKKATRLTLGIWLLTLPTGCGLRTARVQTLGVPVNNDYLDIQPGWRLTVVTPILKSGGYILQTPDKASGSGNTFTISAGADFEGYEVSHYRAEAQRGGRVRVEMNSAEITKEGETEPQSTSIAPPMFQTARGATHLRLIYLVRVSQADHNMAVVTARNIDALDALTRQVRTDPANGCKADRSTACVWVPEGIAVRAEALKTVDGVEKWVDAPR